MKNIEIIHACEGNLKDITVSIPRNKLVLLTGLSGSGKSTLATDVLFQECQRQYLEAMAMEGIRKPKVEAIHNVSPAIHISQAHRHKNPRSTVGTQTDIYTDLRMIYEKLSKRTCPYCHKDIFAYACKEEVEKKDSEFIVSMYCSECNHKMPKLTRTYFSHNTREGACSVCEGMGRTLTIRRNAIFHEELSLEDGAIDLWEQKYKEYQINILNQTFHHYQVPIMKGTPLKNFTPLQRAILEDGVESEKVKELAPHMKTPKTVSAGKFEGVLTMIWRRVHDQGTVANNLQKYFQYQECDHCHGERLQEDSRNATVMDERLPNLVTLSLDELYSWIITLEASLIHDVELLVHDYMFDLKTKLLRLIRAGLGYLCIDRQTMTLSGGESQRILLAASLDSDLTGILYILDEPTIGLHPKDTAGILQILKDLRDKGNTVLVIEHDIDLMKEADWIIDIGPGAGINGGEIVAQGTYEDILKQPKSITGNYLSKPYVYNHQVRKGNGLHIEIEHATMHNLKDVHVRFPLCCMTCITGVSGTGKSTLIFDVLAKKEEGVRGLDQFDHVITIEQAPLTRMKRSNIATFSQVYTHIRKIFGQLDLAKKMGFDAKDFSFNSQGGRCENCEGLGYVTSNMLFFEDVDVPCPVCEGKQFHEDILNITFQGLSIHDVLQLSIEDACHLFQNQSKILQILTLLQKVGLGYVTLGQTLTTLSVGEGQRLKLARELLDHMGENNLYLIDEPTTGLHPIDVDNFLILLNTIVDVGNTVIVVEHNQQIINASDWIIDLGPEGGIHGGNIIAVGTPSEIRKNVDSITGKYL